MTADPVLFVLDLGLMSTTGDIFNSGRILRASPDGTSIEAIVTGQHLPDSLDIAHRARRIYWTCMGLPGAADGAVWSAHWDGSDVCNVLPPGTLITPKQLVVDQSGNRLYVCDREGLRIVRCHLDGSRLEDVVRTGDPANAEHRADPMRYCVGLAIDWHHRIMYWTQKGPPKGNKGRIFRASIDISAHDSSTTAAGRQDIECVLDRLPEPVDLDIDQGSRILYWTDRGDLPYGNSLNRCPLSALDNAAAAGAPLQANGLAPPPFEVLARNLHEAIGLKLDVNRERIFVADLGGCVYDFGLNNGSRRKLYEDLGAYAGISLTEVACYEANQSVIERQQ